MERPPRGTERPNAGKIDDSIDIASLNRLLNHRSPVATFITAGRFRGDQSLLVIK
jgi:hypothetical protein